MAVEHAAGGAAGHGNPIQPLHQFEVHPIGPEISIGGLNLWFNNAAMWMLIVAALACALMILGMRRRAVIPGRAQSVAESLYEFVAGMVRDNAGNEGLRYFPFIFTIFIFILLSNLLGLIPGSFTVTSHIIVTLALALTVFFAAMVVVAVIALVTEDGEWDNWVFLLAMLFNAVVWGLSYERRRTPA